MEPEPTQAVLVVQPAPPSPELQADIFELSTLFFVALAFVFCARRLLAIFRADHP